MIEIHDKIFLTHIKLNTDKDIWYNLIVKDHKNRKNYRDFGVYNFKLDDNYKNFSDYIYSEFLTYSKTLYKEIKLLSENKKDCWAYVCNKYESVPVIHNHLRTAIINSVYYLTVPDKQSGSIDFFDDDLNIIYSHYPKEEELLIFPGYLNHRPNISNSDEYRISINMEIKAIF